MTRSLHLGAIAAVLRSKGDQSVILPRVPGRVSAPAAGGVLRSVGWVGESSGKGEPCSGDGCRGGDAGLVWRQDQ